MAHLKRSKNRTQEHSTDEKETPPEKEKRPVPETQESAPPVGDQSK